MKKIYITPQILAVTLSTAKHTLVTASLDEKRTITNSDGFGSRRGRNAWDDEEDEDDDY